MKGEVPMLYEVVNPCGEEATEAVPGAARLDSLGGKTVCEVALGEFRTDDTFPIIRKMLQEKYPTVKVVPYMEFPLTTVASWQGVKKEETAKVWRTVLKKKGCDAVITGNGG